jgi:hypothetical protein
LYYVYPDDPIAAEALQEIGAAMAEAGVVGLGRLTLSRRERMVMVEPAVPGWRCSRCACKRSSGITIHSAEGDLAAEMAAIIPTAERPFDQDVRRPLSRGLAAADRGQDERAHDQNAGGCNTIAGDRFDGCLETQPGTGNTRRETRWTTKRNPPKRHQISVKRHCCCRYLAAENGKTSRNGCSQQCPAATQKGVSGTHHMAMVCS